MFNVYDLSWEDIVKACEIGNHNFYAQFNKQYYNEYNQDSNIECIQLVLDQMAELRNAYKEEAYKAQFAAYEE